MRDGKVVTDDADEMHGLAEDARGERGIAGGAAEQIFLLILWSFDIIKGDTACDDDGHIRG